MTDDLSLPAVFNRFFDDAAVFPPGRAPLDRAVRDHVARRSTPLGASVGPLLLTPERLDEAAQIHEGTGDAEPLRVGIVVAPGGLDHALAAVDRVRPAIEVTGLELKTTNDDLDSTVAAAMEPAERFDVHVELSVEQIRSGALESIYRTPLRLKTRTGGLVPEAFPSVDDLATAITAAVHSDTSFKLTAGLHRGVRHTDGATGFVHHGFLNIAVATATALLGGDHSSLAAILEERSGGVLAERFAAAGTDWRSYFESFGTCSIAEPVETLAELGLIPSVAP